MPEKFIGAEVRAGHFTNDKGEVVNFNNLMMTFVKPGTLGCMVNDKAPLVKVKNSREEIFRVFGEMITVKWLQERLGWFADVFYDEKKKVAKIIFYGAENPYDGSSSSAPAISNEGITGLTANTSAEDVGALSGMSDFPGETVTSAESAPAESSPADSSADKKGGKK